MFPLISIPKKGIFWLSFLFCFAAHSQTLTSFRFDKSINTDLKHNIVCIFLNDSEIVGLVPFNTPLSTLIATFETPESEVTVTVNEILQENNMTPNDFSVPLVYVVAHEEKSRNYYVKLMHTGLPSVLIYTDNEQPINSKDIYVNGNVTVYPNAAMESYGVLSAAMQIKGRGNTTWDMPKKPYKIKLSKKESVLGMPADKEWVLLANYSDKTLLRNATAFEVSKRFGMAYTPNAFSVDVFLNDKFEGTYLLTEQVKISSGRVNITELKDNDVDGESITGGYLLEVDERLDEDLWFRTSRNVPFTIKEPSLNTAQFNYIQQYVQQAEDALFGSDFKDPAAGYQAYLNTETFVNWYLINELFKNNDAIFWSSVYMFKDRNGKLSMGPVWDYDISAGNINYNNNDRAAGWWVRNALWITRLFQDPAFKSRVKARWNELKGNAIINLPQYIDQKASQLTVSQQYNFHKWDILNTYVWPNAVVTGSYEGEISYLKNWLTERITWMDNQLNIKPFNLLTPAAGQSLVLHPNKPSVVNFSWQLSNAGIRYKIAISRSAHADSLPIMMITSGSGGLDPFFQLSSSGFISALLYNGYKAGDSLTLYWKVFAMIENDSVASVQTNPLYIRISKVLFPFHLASPLYAAEAEVPFDPSFSLPFTWNASVSAERYKLLLTNGLNKPIYSINVQNKDTFASINSNLLQDLLVKYGVKSSDTAFIKVQWTVYAYDIYNDSLKALNNFPITLYSVDTSTDVIPQVVKLVSPLHNISVITEKTDTSTLRFVWTSSDHSSPVSYKWYGTSINNSLSDPFYTVSTRDTFFELPNHYLDKWLKSEGIGKGDSLPVRWTVYAYKDGEADSVKALQTYVINVKRKRILQPFSLLSPVTETTFSNTLNNSFPVIPVSWNSSSLLPATYYRIEISNENNTLLHQSLSGNNGSDTTYDMENDLIQSWMGQEDSLAVTISVLAFDNDDDSLTCAESSRIMLVKQKPTGLNNYYHHEDLSVYPNPVTQSGFSVLLNGKLLQESALSIYDIHGKKVRSFDLTGNQHFINADDLVNGLYFCEIETGNGRLIQKIIIAR